jgi:hypothetical protein
VYAVRGAIAGWCSANPVIAIPIGKKSGLVRITTRTLLPRVPAARRTTGGKVQLDANSIVVDRWHARC